MALAEARFETMSVGTPDDDGIAVVTFDRPANLNALDWKMFEELTELAARADADADVRVLILTGAGRGFCAGLNLDMIAELPGMSTEQFMEMQEYAGKAIMAMRLLAKPVIAAINGPAAGGGLSLALAADVRIASPAARFGVAVIRLGLSGCDLGMSWMLPRLVGLGYASELMLTGRVVGADEALRIGLVSRVVGPDQLLPAAYDIAREMARNSEFGLRLTKQGLQINVDAPSLHAAIQLENLNQVLASRTEEMQSTLAAFLETENARRAARKTSEGRTT